MTLHRPLRALGIALAGIISCTPLKADDLAPGDAGALGAGNTDAGADDGPDGAVDSGPACDPSKPFGTPRHVDGLWPKWSVQQLRLSHDQTVAYYSGLSSTAGYSLLTATRTSPGLVFENDALLAVSGIDMTSSWDKLDPSVRADGLLLVYAQVQTFSNKGQLHWATRPSATVPFDERGVLSVDSAPGTSDTTPYMLDDGQVLYFASDRQGSTGLDIYRATWSQGAFNGARQIPELNSPAIDWEIVVTPDELTAYFASYRTALAARGGDDIYVATRASVTDPFSPPQNVGELNSSDNEAPSFVSADGCTLYFATNHYSTGAWDIYAATKPK